jgi:hypothetical protein
MEQRSGELVADAQLRGLGPGQLAAADDQERVVAGGVHQLARALDADAVQRALAGVAGDVLDSLEGPVRREHALAHREHLDGAPADLRQHLAAGPKAGVRLAPLGTRHLEHRGLRVVAVPALATATPGSVK